jgi:GNAT superfamily N-acetyltransferase
LTSRTPAGAVEFRPAVPADEPFLRELDGALVAEQLGGGGLDQNTLTRLAELQFTARRRDRAAHYPEAGEQVIMLDGRPVGAILVDRSSERILIVDLALVHAARQQGIGTTIVAALAAEAAQRGVPLRATTQSSNAGARQFYARAGLQEIEDDGLNVSLQRLAGQTT